MGFQRLDLTVMRFPSNVEKLPMSPESKIRGKPIGEDFFYFAFFGSFSDPDIGDSIGSAQEKNRVRKCEFTDILGLKELFAELADNFFPEAKKEKDEE